MKVTTNQAIDLLKTLGLDAELVEEADSDYDEVGAVQAVDSSRRSILEPLIEKEKSENIRRDVAGMMSGTLSRQVKRVLGFDPSTLPADTKWEDILKAGLEYKSSQLDSDKQSVQKEIDEMLEKHQQYVDTLTEQHKKELSEAQQRYVDRDIFDSLFTELKDAPILPNADRSVVTGDLKSYLYNKYIPKYNEETKKVELYDKNSPELHAMNAEKTHKIDILSEAKNFLTPRGLWATDTRGVNAGDVADKNGADYNGGNNSKKTIALGGNAGEKRAAFLQQVASAAEANS